MRAEALSGLGAVAELQAPVLGGRAEPGGNQERAELVAAQGHGEPERTRGARTPKR